MQSDSGGERAGTRMRRPLGLILLVVFFEISAMIVLFVGIALTWPGTAFETVWELYPQRRAELMPYAAWMGPMFLALFGVFSAASVGFVLLRKWGWYLAVAIFGANMAGDAAQLAMGNVLEGAIGITVSGFILYYLWQPKVRAAFT